MRTLSLAISCGLIALFGSGLRAADPKPVNLPCNTEANEDDPHISGDGRFLIHSSDAAGKYDIVVSSRSSTRRPWPKGKPLGDYVQTEMDDRSVFLVAGGRLPHYLFFATKKDKNTNNFDLYVAVKNTPRSAFSAPTPLHTIDTAEDEMHPWLTRDGRRLYFSRKTKDGWRVYVASRQATTGAAGFGEPKLLKELPVGFHHPTLTPDGKTMYLQGPLEKERWGLFVSTRTKDGWSKPEPLSINHTDGPTGDVSPCLSRDGKILYFASDRPGGKGKRDLWAIRTADAKPEK